MDSRSEDAVKTIYVSGLKDSTSQDAITYFFENKKRTGGGALCGRKERFKRLSPTVARLTFDSSKGIVNSVSDIIMQSATDHIYTCKIKKLTKKFSKQARCRKALWEESGVENVSDHGTIGPRKFWGLPEIILTFRSKLKKEFIGQT